MSRILTGIKPTGLLHLGNYVGAVKQLIDLSQIHDSIYVFVADYHALNTVHNADTLGEMSQALVAAYLAFGLDPEQVIIYRQSDIPEIFELETILCAVTPKGLMNRAHAYKAAIDVNQSLGKTADEIDVGINMGLYNYPILMASDIVCMDADLVPVGKDQVQHLEFTRDIVARFNHRYGEILKQPEVLVAMDGAVIPGLDGRKMSKSYENYIPLFADSALLKRLVMKKIVTDTAAPEAPKDPNQSVIFQLYKEFAQPGEVEAMRQGFIGGGLGYGSAKKQLFEVLDAFLTVPRQKYKELLTEPQYLNSVLKAGAIQARETSTQVLQRVRQSIGVAFG